jgi:hypothetical protein
MNSFRATALAVALFLAGAGCPALIAEDWTTIDGTVYKDVKVIKVEDDAVTILDRDGGGRVPLVMLAPALQARFHYDFYKANAAAAARLQAERIQAEKVQAALDAKYKAAKQAVDDERAAAAAAEPRDDPFHSSNFDLDKTDDTRPHYNMQSARHE